MYIRLMNPYGEPLRQTSGLSGDSHPDWKGINYVESTSGAWVRVTGAGSNYGFVDTGLGVASGYSSIPMYGRW